VAAGLPSSKGKAIEYACVEDGQIVVQEYSKTNPFARLPWPQPR
jgi:hypothetical protein